MQDGPPAGVTDMVGVGLTEKIATDELADKADTLHVVVQ